MRKEWGKRRQACWNVGGFHSFTTVTISPVLGLINGQQWETAFSVVVGVVCGGVVFVSVLELHFTLRTRCFILFSLFICFVSFPFFFRFSFFFLEYYWASISFRHTNDSFITAITTWIVRAVLGLYQTSRNQFRVLGIPSSYTKCPQDSWRRWT